MNQPELDFSRGDEDIVFVKTDLDMNKISEKENPRESLLEKMREKGLKIQNGRIMAIFKSEFSLILQENTKISFNGNQVYPGR